MTTQFTVYGSLDKIPTGTQVAPALNLQLFRYPQKQISNLQAWDAADEHIINYLLQNKIIDSINGPISIINDSYGAISCAIQTISPAHTLYIETDAKTSCLGIQENLKINHLNQSNICWQNSRDLLPQAPQLVIIKLPKNLSYFASQLIALSQTISKDTLILIGAKAKSINSALLNIIEKNLGSAAPSLTWKKTRIIQVAFDGIKRITPAAQTWSIPEYELQVSNLSNVFAANKLDIGARLMLENMPQGHFNSVIDLGCGNGVLGLQAAHVYPDADIHFVDDSEMAVESSRINWQVNGFNNHLGHFHWSDCLSELESSTKADLILCNPPFHQGEAITDHIAWQMFNDAKKALTKNGLLQVVGNRHLNYHIKLKRLFGNCKTIAANKKFVILQSYK